MNNISIACSAMMLCTSAIAGIDISIEKDVLELGVTASVTDNAYLFIGGDTDEWIGIGLGYHTFLTPQWKANAYYEYGLENDWLVDEILGIDGVKTHTHFIELSATRYFEKYAAKFGVTNEYVRNGFTWITVDNANKYSGYASLVKYFKHLYVSGKYEYHYAQDKSDMTDFNQGQANEWELSIGPMRPIWKVYPYAQISAFSPNGTYYGMNKTDFNWTIGGRISF